MALALMSDTRKRWPYENWRLPQWVLRIRRSPSEEVRIYWAERFGVPQLNMALWTREDPTDYTNWEMVSENLLQLRVSELKKIGEAFLRAAAFASSNGIAGATGTGPSHPLDDEVSEMWEESS